MCPPGIQTPLLDWPERREVDRLESVRRELMGRIHNLPRNAHKRVELEARLRTLTTQQLQLALTMDKGEAHEPAGRNRH